MKSIATQPDPPAGRVKMVLSTGFSAGEELKSTMKLTRQPIAAKYAAEIEALYAA